MATYIWNDMWTTGIPLMDSQHKQLFDALNALLDACSNNRASEQVDKTLNFLANYTVKHFGDEERLQIQYGYPDFASHKKLHDNFKKFVSELAAEIKAEGPTVPLIAKVNFGVGDWLIQHIYTEDKKIAEYIKSKAKLT
ncbi:MAG: hemerythrin family protein [Clostridiales bacterium]|jgi:hemerythrin|nr:hemerythrin family protein [Clostridiales bacterium]